MGAVRTRLSIVEQNLRLTQRKALRSLYLPDRSDLHAARMNEKHRHLIRIGISDLKI